MSTVSVLRVGAIGIIAVTVSTAALGIIIKKVGWVSLEPSVGVLCAGLAVLGAMAWVCVRFAQFRPAVAMLLTTAPFGFLTAAAGYEWLLDRRIAILFISSVVLLLLAILATWVATRIGEGAIRLSKRRISYIVATVVLVPFIWALAMRFLSVPIHPFDHSWNMEHQIPIDRTITRMAARAQFDAYVFGVPLIGRGKLQLAGASKHGPDYDLGFTPTYASDTGVLYRFRADGKPLWKTCNWVNVEAGWRKALERRE